MNCKHEHITLDKQSKHRKSSKKRKDWLYRYRCLVSGCLTTDWKSYEKEAYYSVWWTFKRN